MRCKRHCRNVHRLRPYVSADTGTLQHVDDDTLCRAAAYFCRHRTVQGHLQVMVGDLYNEQRYAAKRDTAFSLFYMAINLGSMYAPGAAIALKNMALKSGGFLTSDPMAATVSNWCLDTDNFTNMPAAGSDQLKAMTDFALKKAWHRAATWQHSCPATSATRFGMRTGRCFTDPVCHRLHHSILHRLQLCFRACMRIADSELPDILPRTPHLRAHHQRQKTDRQRPQGGSDFDDKQPELTPEQTKARVVALLLVFAVVIFFWMVFHQNGQTLTEFAKSCTANVSSSWTRIGFNLARLQPSGLVSTHFSTCSRAQQRKPALSAAQCLLSASESWHTSLRCNSV